MDSDVRVFRTSAELVAKAAGSFIGKMSALSQFRARIHLGLGSGQLSADFLEMVATIVDSHPAEIDDWSPLHVWLTDEYHRGGEEGGTVADRLEEIIADSPLEERLTIHRAPDGPGLSVKDAAAQYATQMLETFGQSRALDPRSVSLDMAILTMAADGHIAALFPSHGALRAKGLVVAEPDSPYPPLQRLTMTVNLLRRSRYSWVLVSGAQCAPLVAHAIHGADFREVVASAMNQVGTTWWCDEEAASRIALDGYT